LDAHGGGDLTALRIEEDRWEDLVVSHEALPLGAVVVTTSEGLTGEAGWEQKGPRWKFTDASIHEFHWGSLCRGWCRISMRNLDEHQPVEQPEESTRA